MLETPILNIPEKAQAKGPFTIADVEKPGKFRKHSGSQLGFKGLSYRPSSNLKGSEVRAPLLEVVCNGVIIMGL